MFTFLVVNREMVVSFIVKDSVGASSRFEYGSAELLICRDRLRGSMVVLSHYSCFDLVFLLGAEKR